MDAVRSAVQSAATAISSTFAGSKKAVHFGGGNIGRGFVAEFLHKSGYEVVFVDVMDDLINSIKATPSYTVTEIGAEGEHTTTITNYRAINSKHDEPAVIHEIATADVVTCAVGPNVLKFIAPVIAKAIEARDDSRNPLAVIACENMIGGTDKLKEYVLEKAKSAENINKRARFANSAIDRIVPGQDPDAGLNVKIEKFYEWCVDKTNFADAKGGYPNITGVHFVDDLEPFIERKLYTVNTSHATAAYYGHNRGKHTIHDAMSDPEIYKLVKETVNETAHLIVNKHGITKEDQDAYLDKILLRISNPHLEDVVERVGRAPMRKISRQERFIGPASQLAERGDKYDALLGGLEMALRFQNVDGDEESVELAQKLKELSAEDAAEKLCGLEPSHPLHKPVAAVIKKVQEST